MRGLRGRWRERVVREGLTDGAKKAPTLEESKDAKGEVTMCAGKDTSGALTKAIALFNKDHPA